VNEIVKFEIKLLDKNSKPIKLGGDDVEVLVEGPMKPDVKIVDTGLGNYLVEFTPSKNGIYTVQAKVNDSLIRDGIFEIKIDGPPTSNSNRSSVVDWGIKIFAPSRMTNDFEIFFKSKNSIQSINVIKDEQKKNKFIASIIPVPIEKTEKHTVIMNVSQKIVSGSPWEQTF